MVNTQLLQHKSVHIYIYLLNIYTSIAIFYFINIVLNEILLSLCDEQTCLLLTSVNKFYSWTELVKWNETLTYENLTLFSVQDLKTCRDRDLLQDRSWEHLDIEIQCLT